jgi:hypothetical protein
MENVIAYRPAEWFLRKSWRRSAGLPEEVEPHLRRGLTIDDLYESEWSPSFERAMRVRLVMGALRHGLIGDPKKPVFDRISSIEKRLKAYKQTGNMEHLVDCANMLLLEFVEGVHPLRHFSSQDEHAMHANIMNKK